MKTEKNATVKLDYPVQLADRLLEEITMRRPTMREQIDFPLGETANFEMEMKLYARLSGLDYEDLLQLDMNDYEKLQEQFVTFRKPETGKRS